MRCTFLCLIKIFFLLQTLVSLEADDDIDDKTKKPHATLSFPVKCKHEPGSLPLNH